jgi:hypothetical protein
VEGGALIIEIGKRAKAKERAADGYEYAEEETEESESDADIIKEDAARDVAKALGIDPDGEGVDLSALAAALCDLYDAHGIATATKTTKVKAKG